MRTVLLGSDFMYDKDGNLKPIEINTAVGYQYNKLESDAEAFDLTNLLNFINTNGFTKVVYIGEIEELSSIFETALSDASIEYEFLVVPNTSITIPYVEDNDTTLIIRSAYDTTAIVDDNYCRDKVQFLDLIKSESFGAQFAYINDENQLVNHITTINDNGNHPNFILKSRYPQYDKNVFPKLFKVSSQEELSVVLENVTSDYFLMEFYFNSEKTYQNHIRVIRELSLLHPPSLQAIQIGSYTSFTNDSILGTNTFDSESFELLDDRDKYIAKDSRITLPKLQDTDLVVMEDGSFKTGLDLQIGDMVKTISIPNPFDVNKREEVVNYKISFEELESGTTYSSNRVTNKKRINKFYHVVKLTFTDGSDWLDTENSKYLSSKDGEVRFLILTNNELSENQLSIGDKIVLLDTTTTTPTFIEKEVANIEHTQEFFGGWVITVENEGLFLTRAAEEDGIANMTSNSFVAVEHNFPGQTCSRADCIRRKTCSGKFEICCFGVCTS
jgi:hypothetical protein